MKYNLANYKKVEVETTNPMQLVILLYEGAINFLEQAKSRMLENCTADKGTLISKTMAIINELQSSLNMEKGGEVAGNMDRIYTYLTHRLMEANSNNDNSILDEVCKHMRTLKDAWVKSWDTEKDAVADNQKAVNTPYADSISPQAYSARPDNAALTGSAVKSSSDSVPEQMPAIEIVG